MTRLSVNVNKIATLRNARGGNNPDVIYVAKMCEQFGAQGITVHPRPDERHITRKDVYDLRPQVTTEFNIEGNPDERFNRIVDDVIPHQVTLVPDAPTQLTSNCGWDCVKNLDHLSHLVDRFHDKKIRVSIFVGTDLDNIRAAADTGADRIELYTEPYAKNYAKDRNAAIAPFIEAARLAKSLGLGLNAGHDLSLGNLTFFHQQIPCLDEVSIGHALICDALFLGLEETIHRYLNCLKGGSINHPLSI
ncbi:MAG: pyridoxine 5'-phosphate synthase [Paludibacteraceae bacterium]|nr:pyridoxine 5'-phosphate synthase [Paludibacteraceae bacterium]